MGVRLPETKTLRELDVRSGYVFNVDVDTTNQIATLRQKAGTIPKNAKFSRGWVIEQICRLAECEIATPLDLAELLLGESATLLLSTASPVKRTKKRSLKYSISKKPPPALLLTVFRSIQFQIRYSRISIRPNQRSIM